MNKEVLSKGNIGFSARSIEEWVESISWLLDSPEQRRRLGITGRDIVEDHYSLHVLGPKLAELLKGCSALGDSAYIVADSGFTAPPRGPEALANAIARLIEMGRAGRWQLGTKARQRIETEFSLPAIVRRYEDLYRTYSQNDAPP
jgi:glycosyltransferase involved in cell wall biosynthesis